MKTIKYLAGFILLSFAFYACSGNDPLGSEKEEEVNDDPVYVEIDIKPCNNESDNTLELKEVETILHFVQIRTEPSEAYSPGHGLIYYYFEDDTHIPFLSMPVFENMHTFCHICNLPEDITEWNTNEHPYASTVSQKKIILSGTIHVDSITPSSGPDIISGFLEIKSLKITEYNSEDIMK